MNLIATMTLKKQLVPATRVPSANILCTLRDGGGAAIATAVANLDSEGKGAFQGVPDGTYTVSAQRVGMDGQLMGDIAESEPIEVVNTHEVDVPATVVVTVA